MHGQSVTENGTQPVLRAPKASQQRYITHVGQPGLCRHRSSLLKGPLCYRPGQDQPQQVRRALDLSPPSKRARLVSQPREAVLSAKQRNQIVPLILNPLPLIHPLIHTLRVAQP